MRTLLDEKEFCERVGMIFDPRKLQQLGILPAFGDAIFAIEDLPRLLAFCRGNPAYHVISTLKGGIEVNRYDSNGLLFSIGDGDQDPELALQVRLVDPFAAGLGVRRPKVHH